MELSHRSKEFESVLSETESNLRTLLSIPANYKILFMQGGATSQFSAVVFNLLGARFEADKIEKVPVDYVITGAW